MHSIQSKQNTVIVAQVFSRACLKIKSPNARATLRQQRRLRYKGPTMPREIAERIALMAENSPEPTLVSNMRIRIKIDIIHENNDFSAMGSRIKLKIGTILVYDPYRRYLLKYFCEHQLCAKNRTSC